MAKVKSKYICQQCNYETPRWLGKCPNCDTWGSLVETVVETSSRSSDVRYQSKSLTPQKISEVKTQKTKHTSTKISELDRVLGGGIVAGQVILLAGEPGIGKSTILMQLSGNMGNTLYFSGEESVYQVKLRAERLGIKSTSVYLAEGTDIDTIISTAHNQTDLKLLVVDSIQTVSTSDLSGMAGSVGQVRECTYRLVQFAKSTGCAVVVVGHVTKQGSVAGPAVLAHLVDTVLWFEGEQELSLRLIRAIKNRFGATDEVGVFSMEEKGLIEQSQLDSIFISHEKSVPGSVKTCVLQGSRPIFLEIQSLVVPSKLINPRRVAQGIDSKRLELLLAVLTRRCGIPLYDSDCFVNVAGGFNVKNDPSVDLAVCLSLASSFYEKSVPENSISFGEVGLLGDVRKVLADKKRKTESRRLGYKTIVTAETSDKLLEIIRKYLK